MARTRKTSTVAREDVREGSRESSKEGPRNRVDPAALDALIGGRTTAVEVEDLFREMKRHLMERILSGELTHHLGYAEGEEKPPEQSNHRNGKSSKTVITEDGAVSIAVPRDRNGTFEPKLVPKHVRRLPRFDQNVLSLYARGMTVREIQAHLEELYQVSVAPDVISTVTDGVLEEVTAWQQRPLDACYPVVIFDALRVKIRSEGVVRSKAIYLALGVQTSGQKDLLGLWVEQSEGAAFWHRVMTELSNRGVRDILIALVDGLAGFPAAIATVFPETEVHQCVVHLVRRSLTFVSWKDRKAVAAHLKTIYRAPSEEAALAALRDFEVGPWAAKYPTIAPIWRRAWDQVTPAFKYPLSVRRLLSTTNAIESVNMQLRKIIKTRGHFPTDEAATKLIYLALRNIADKWRRPSKEWLTALPHLVLLFGDRFTPTEE
jgi:putative transposase